MKRQLRMLTCAYTKCGRLFYAVKRDAQYCPGGRCQRAAYRAADKIEADRLLEEERAAAAKAEKLRHKKGNVQK